MAAQVKSEDAPSLITALVQLSGKALAKCAPVPSLPQEAMNHQSSLAVLQHTFNDIMSSERWQTLGTQLI